MKYNCIICHKGFHQKSNYDAHINRKFKCKTDVNSDDNDNNNECVHNVSNVSKSGVQNVSNVSIDGVQNVSNIEKYSNNHIKTYNCLHCNKKYMSSQSLSKHKKKHINDTLEDNINEDQDKYLKLADEHEKIKDELNELKSIVLCKESISKKNTHNTTNTHNMTNTHNTTTATNAHNTHNTNSHNNVNVNNNCNNKNLTINYVNYGNEDLNRLTKEEHYKIINSRSDAIYTMLETLHQNPRLPEYNNIFVNNLRSKNIHVLTDGKFVVENRKATIENMISNMAYNIETIMNQTKPISTKQKKLLSDNFYWLKTFEIYIEDVDGNFVKSDKKLIDKYKCIYNKYEMLLYNNRHMAPISLLSDKTNKLIQQNDDVTEDINNTNDETNEETNVETNIKKHFLNV